MTFHVEQPPYSSDPDVNRIVEWANRQFIQIQQQQTMLNYLVLPPTYSEPSKPLEGMVVHADGTSWNPGNGQGFYIYADSEWTRIAGPVGGAQWDDMRFPATAINPPGAASDPDIDTTYGWWLFDSATTELIFLVVQLPHAWKEGSDLSPHVHWAKTTAASGNVYWQLDYRWMPIGETMDGSWTTLADYTPDVSDSDTAYHHALTGLGTISGTGKQISDILICKLSRIGGNGNDTYGADAALIEFDIHYQIDSFGSTGLFDKDGV